MTSDHPGPQPSTDDAVWKNGPIPVRPARDLDTATLFAPSDARAEQARRSRRRQIGGLVAISVVFLFAAVWNIAAGDVLTGIGYLVLIVLAGVVVQLVRVPHRSRASAKRLTILGISLAVVNVGIFVASAFV